ncbi:DNA repair protein [Vibrio cincinnatiensis]|uniref:DNA repair protein RadC n=1 Tax=Vibrio cincinnatiensis DSM 19608 TaxID=1123491 RepID=A0A1T4NFF7_VIBCI|nr:DNA repair protein RadC [Vibrio cincinnatiensis]SJZ78002.1 DNA repair protein RadC [Vibrio cincinnatiensis DSM 19608]SUP49078.1 DNA repair protein [Vibrio cincinnatiensis]
MIDYTKEQRYQENQILEHAAEILAHRYVRGNALTNPDATKEYIRCKLGAYEHEVFALLLLDNQNRLIEFKELFHGTIDAASVYPREVVKAALACNAAAVIFAHNHPSGQPEPSEADKRITQRLKDALALVDIRVLDHIVVGEGCVSFAERGLL